jgi:hypothetical protein
MQRRPRILDSSSGKKDSTKELCRPVHCICSVRDTEKIRPS